MSTEPESISSNDTSAIQTALRHSIRTQWLILTLGLAVLAEKLRSLCGCHDFGNALQVSASFGITQFRADDRAESFTARVDQALYLAKKNGRKGARPSANG